MKEKAFNYIDSKKGEILALWEELVNTESGSEYIEGVDAVASKVKQTLDEAGAKTRLVEYSEAGNSIIAEFDGDESKPGIIFMGHMDTVFPKGEVAKRPFTIKDGKAYGPGVLDMKGGVVAGIFAAKALKEAGFKDRPIKLMFAGDEEVAHRNSDAAEVFMKEAKDFAAAFNCETASIDNSIVVGRKGTATFKVVVHGVAAHAGNNHKGGRSAILEMSHKVIDIQNLTNFEKEYTFNVGTIKGGVVFNAVPDYCEIGVDVRYVDPVIVPKLKEMVEKTLAKTYIEGTKTELVDFRVGIQAMKTTEGVQKLFDLLVKVSEENGFPKPTAVKSGGGSDSAYTVMAGVPTLCSMGVKGANNHSKEEYAIVDSIFEKAKLLVAMVLSMDNFK